MIGDEGQFKLQAYVDGELSPREVREVEEWVAKDREARKVLAELKVELRIARGVLIGYGEGIKLPETREFFWSKIERQIQFEESRATETKGSFFASWRKFLVPAASVAAFAVVGMLAVLGPDRSSGPEYEAALSDPGALTYRDYASGTTLVWLSYPAENEVAEDETGDSIQ